MSDFAFGFTFVSTAIIALAVLIGGLVFFKAEMRPFTEDCIAGVAVGFGTWLVIIFGTLQWAYGGKS